MLKLRGIGTGSRVVMPDLIGHPAFLDSRFRGNDTHGQVIEFAETFEKKV
jgi:hypothetical protein